MVYTRSEIQRNGVEIPFPWLVNHCLLHGCSCLGTEILDYLWVMEGYPSALVLWIQGKSQYGRSMTCHCAVTKFVFIPKYPKAMQQAINTLNVTAY